MNFSGKNILFYGPAKTSDKPLDLSVFDIIIITNNMINIFFDNPLIMLHNRNKVILLTNKLYTLNYTDRIKQHVHQLSAIWTVESSSHQLLKKIFPTKCVTQLDNLRNPKYRIKGIPLGLTRFLVHVRNLDFKYLYITGVTFYSDKINIQHNYEEKYMIEEGHTFNILNKDKKLHHLKSNITYARNFVKNRKNVGMCKELQNIFNNF